MHTPGDTPVEFGRGEMGMPAPFRQTHYIEGELIGLKCQVQLLGRAHLPPRGDLPLVKRAESPAQSLYSIVRGECLMIHRLAFGCVVAASKRR